MPAFHDPLHDAAEASEALRGLAHASRVFDDPADTYGVFGDVVAGVRSLRQVLDQLAATHLDHRDRAHDEGGNHSAGSRNALAAADELHRAGSLLDQAYDRLDAAFGHSGQIAWHPGPAVTPGAPSEAIAQRWVSVVFLQGEQAEEVLDLIDRDGATAAIEHLRGFDYGEETTDAALENGYVYDELPTGVSDRVVTDGDYALTYDPAHGHVSLLRAHTATVDPTLDEPDVVPVRDAITGIGPLDPSTRDPAPGPGPVRSPPMDGEKDWFSNPVRSAESSERWRSL